MNHLLKIDGIECSTIIGCHSYERNEHQPILVNLELTLNQQSYNDDIRNTVNYSEVSDYVKGLVSLSHVHLLESLAIELAKQILNKYAIVSQIGVSLSKPKVNGKKARSIECIYSEKRHYKVALALGSNQNSPSQQLITAIELLVEFISDIKVAPFYQSAPQGFTDQENFCNTCISGYTTLPPELLLAKTKKIEKLMGKMEQFTNGPRIIDIDIILFDNMIYHGLFLKIPHQRMTERDFVLRPLAEIEPEWVHPETHRSVNELLQQLGPEQQFIIQEK